MGAIKNKIIELAELAYEIMNTGASEKEVDEYVESQVSPDEYEFYHVHKDVILDMFSQIDESKDKILMPRLNEDSFYEEETQYDLDDEDFQDSKDVDKFDDESDDFEPDEDTLGDDLSDYEWDVGAYLQKLLNKEGIEYNEEQLGDSLRDRMEEIKDNLLDQISPEETAQYLFDDEDFITEIAADDFDEDKMREDLYDPQDDPPGRNIITGEIDESYIMPLINETEKKYDIHKICRIAINNANAWINHQDFIYFKNESARIAKEGAPFEEIKDFYYDFLDTHIDKFFDIFEKQNLIERMFLDDHRDEILDYIVEKSMPQPHNQDMEEDPVLAAAIKQSTVNFKKPNKVKDYSHMSQRELENAVSDAIDSNDFETLRKIQPYIKESLQLKIDKVLNENSQFLMDPLKEGCGCGSKKRPTLFPRGKQPIVKRPPVKKLFEKFIEQSDPIHDMDIGMYPKKIAKKFLNAMHGNISRIAVIYFKRAEGYHGHVEVLYGFFKRIKEGESVQDAFLNSCLNENFYGDRKDIIEDRVLIADVIKRNFKIDVDPYDPRF